jgi:type VI secretion system secreted protein VgrG
MSEGKGPSVVLLGEGLPGDVIVLDLRAEEALSELYSVTVRFSTHEAGFAIDGLLRHRLVARAIDGTGSERVFDGIVLGARFITANGGAFVFEVDLGPQLASLQWRRGCRIFQDTPVRDIVSTLLKEAGVDERVEWRLRKTYEPRVFCTQYRESELDFMRRLLEDEGVHFFFTHDLDGHTLVFSDDPGALGGDGEPMLLSGATGAKDSSALSSIRRRLKLRRSAMHVRDYDPEKPAAIPESLAQFPAPFGLAGYAYPGGFVDAEAAKRKTQARLDADRADADVIRGVTAGVGVAPGLHVKVEGTLDEFLEGKLVVTKLVTEVRRDVPSAEDGAPREPGDGDHCAISTTFEAIPENTPHTPVSKTARPCIRGLHTARVTGASHEEQAIHVDELGRVKVRFLWDRAGKNDDTTSCWLRVSQVHLGGSMIHPRVDWEVAVAFLDGDPDRPHVVGRLYDGEHAPPRALPGAAADSSIQSSVTPGAGGMNAFHMTDGGGAQKFGVTAQKDMNTVVGDCRTETIAGNETIAVATNHSVEVTGDDTQTVSGDQSIDVGDAHQVKVGGAQSITVGAGETIGTVADMKEKSSTRDETIGASRITISNGVRETVTGAMTRDVGSVQVHLAAGGMFEECEATFDESASAVIVHLVGGTHAETVGGAKTLESTAAELHVASSLTQTAGDVTQLIGAARVRLVSGDLTISAPTVLLGGGVGHFIVGGSSIKLNGGPVTITGSSIKLDAPVINKSGGSLKLG